MLVSICKHLLICVIEPVLKVEANFFFFLCHVYMCSLVHMFYWLPENDNVTTRDFATS